MKKDGLAIWGCGFEGEKLYYDLQIKGIEINRIYDSNKDGFFHKKKIIKPTRNIDDLKRWKILISTEKYYTEIKKQLEVYGLQELDDFILGKMYGKKIAIINANCYGGIIKKFLNSNNEFRRKYYIYQTIAIHLKQDINMHILKRCDLFIHQDIKEDNNYGYFYSDKYLQKYLKKNCIDITMPNLVGMGKIIFPQADNNDTKNFREGMEYGLFPYSDVNIDNLAEQEKSCTDIIKILKSGEVFKNEYILSNFNNVVSKFKEREKNWDVKIIDYILMKYKDEKVFFDLYHPTNIILEKIVEGILDILDIKKEKLSCESDLGAYEIPIYPEVKKVLNLSYGDIKENIRKKSYYKLKDKMDMEEYIKEYFYWCFS